ncbi:MAG: M48 family metalloprotease [bacterium]
MTLYTQQDKNIKKTWLLMAAFLAIIISLGYFISYYYNSPGILYFAIIFSVLMNIISYWYSDKIVLSISHALEAKHDEYTDLYHIVENLSITAGLPMPKIYIINDASPNAFATGRNKEHAVIAVTTGLLRILNKIELEGVVAHELSHIGNRDILLSTVIVVLIGFISILANIFTRGLFFGGRDRNERSGSIIMIIGIIFVILSPIVATLIQLAISRKREFLADASGALLTRYPDGLASALQKISSANIPIKNPNTATAHLYISNPFGNTKKIMSLFSTHPPVKERVEALMGMKRN